MTKEVLYLDNIDAGIEQRRSGRRCALIILWINPEFTSIWRDQVEECIIAVTVTDRTQSLTLIRRNSAAIH